MSEEAIPGTAPAVVATQLIAAAKYPATKQKKGHTKRVIFEEDEVSDARLGDLKHDATEHIRKFAAGAKGDVECSLVGTVNGEVADLIFAEKLTAPEAERFLAFVTDHRKVFTGSYPRHD